MLWNLQAVSWQYCSFPIDDQSFMCLLKLKLIVLKVVHYSSLFAFISNKKKVKIFEAPHPHEIPTIQPKVKADFRNLVCQSQSNMFSDSQVELLRMLKRLNFILIKSSNFGCEHLRDCHVMASQPSQCLLKEYTAHVPCFIPNYIFTFSAYHQVTHKYNQKRTAANPCLDQLTIH